MFEYSTLWDIYEVKFIIFLVSVFLAIIATNYLHSNNKGKKDETGSDTNTDKIQQKP